MRFPPALLLATVLLLPGQAGSDDRVEPGQRAPRPPLVVEKEGLWTLDRFEACGPGDGTTTLQVLVHGEAPKGDLDRERFAASVARASGLEIEKASPGAVCREIAAPDGDVDREIRVRVSAAGVEVATVELPDATLDVNYHMRQVRRNATAEAPPGRCDSTAMGQTYCAQAPQGVAVRTTMGEVVCARGDCVRETNGDWHCARQSGGQAVFTPSGPACDGGCYAPTARQCRRV
jgi:hypothetical protein